MKSSIAVAGSKVIPSIFTCAKRRSRARRRMRLAGHPVDEASSFMLSIFIWRRLLNNAIIMAKTSYMYINI